MELATARLDIAKLYLASFNRVADTTGLDYWTTRYMNGETLSDIAQLFTGEPEYKAKYPAIMTEAEYVAAIYSNVFGRTADAAGQAHWESMLANGTATKATLMNWMVSSALNDDALRLANQAEFAVQSVLQHLDPVVTSAQLASITANAASVQTALTGSANGETFTLTDATEVVTGTNGNDTFIGTSTALATGTVLLDTINGGTGTDVLAFNDSGSQDVNTFGLTLNSIETINVRSTGAATATTTGFTGVENVNVTLGTSAAVIAASTTAVSVSGVTGAIAIDGGSTQTVTTAGAAVTLGATTVAAGAVSVTHTAQAANAIAIDGGTTVTVASTGSTASTINVGQGGAATDLASGAVSVTSTNAAAATADVTLAAINVDGGSTITATQTAAAAAAATSVGGFTVTQGVVTLQAGTTTTSITSTQSASTAETLAVVAVAEVSQTKTLTFSALTSGQTAVVDGLTFTASKDLTAAEVAAAFAGLTATDRQDAGGKSANGVYTGNTSANWTSANASGATVVFTEVTAAASPALVVGGTGTNPTVVTSVAGTAEQLAVTGVLGVITGQVVIDDNTTAASVTTVSVDGYGNGSTIGATVNMNALTTLSLANSGGATAGAVNGTMAVHTDSTALNLTLNNIQGTVTLDAASAAVTDLNVTTATADSDFALTAAAVTDLTVAGTNDADFTGSTFTALETVVVSGTAGLTLDANVADTITSVNTSATTGTVTTTIDADIATYTGGAGVDNVTLSTTTVDKAVNLGAGNDSLTLATGTTSLTSEMIAGDGTDTLVMVAANAVTASAGTTFEGKITGFEKLSLGSVSVAGTVDMANMDDINYVISANSTGGTVAEVQTFTITHAANAAVSEVQTVALSGTASGAVTFLGAVVTGSANLDSVGVTISNIIADKTAIIATWNGANPTKELLDITYVGGTSLTLTYKTTEGDVAIVGTSTSAGITFADSAQTTAGDTNAGNITIEGVTVAIAAGDSIDTIGAAIDAANYAAQAQVSTVVYDAATDTVTVTYVAGVNELATTTVDTDSVGVTFGAVATTTQGAANGGAAGLTLDNVVNNATLEVTAAGAGVIVTMDDATGTTDTLNVVLNNEATIDFGTLTIAGVETINLTTTDVFTDANEDGVDDAAAVHTVELAAAAAKTINITGAGDLTLDTTSVVLTLVDGSAMTGALTATTNGTVAQTIKGGSAADTLTAATSYLADTLNAGAGNDTLTANAGLTQMTGGAGNDTFVINVASLNSSSYATITDATSGDVIQFTSATAFDASAVAQDSTAVFQDYVNAAMNASAVNEMSWFTYQNNTYIVMDAGANSTTFVNGEDFIVKLSGSIDLSTASYNSTSNTIEIA